MFLASALGLKDECFYSDSEAISHNLGLQPPTVPLNALLPRIHTHSHPHSPSCTHPHADTQAHTPHLDTQSHTRMHSEALTHSPTLKYAYKFIHLHTHSYTRHIRTPHLRASTQLTHILTHTLVHTRTRNFPTSD